MDSLLRCSIYDKPQYLTHQQHQFTKRALPLFKIIPQEIVYIIADFNKVPRKVSDNIYWQQRKKEMLVDSISYLYGDYTKQIEYYGFGDIYTSFITYCFMDQYEHMSTVYGVGHKGGDCNILWCH